MIVLILQGFIEDFKSKKKKTEFENRNKTHYSFLIRKKQMSSQQTRNFKCKVSLYKLNSIHLFEDIEMIFKSSVQNN